MILGISSFTYGWSVAQAAGQFNEQDLLNQTLAFGLRCLQMGDNLPLHTFDQSRLSKLKEKASNEGIRLEIGARGMTDEHLQIYIQLSKYLNVPLLRFVIDGANFQPDQDAVISTIRNVIPILKEKNIVLGIENHDRFKAKELANIMEAIGDDNVGICLDTVNSIGAGEGLAYVSDLLSPYTVNLHIKDFRVTRIQYLMGFTVEGCIAGNGIMDLNMLMDKVGQNGRCQSAILEQWVIPEERIENTVLKEKDWAEQSIQYLKTSNHFKFI